MIDELVRRGMKRLIGAAGYRVALYASGAEFLESLKAGRPACVVLDLFMPDVNGFGVLAVLNRETSRIPVVVISGDNRAEIIARATALGVAAIVAKPVDDTVLLDAIQAAIQSGQVASRRP
jgi:FixJ family two-component response regulator